MAPLDHRLNPLFSIKECMTCGALYTRNCGCSKGSLEDKILVPKPPQNCATCGNPVDGLNCRSCAFVRKCLNEGWYTIHDENKILNTYEPSDDNTNVVSAPREPFVVNQDPGVNSSQSPLQSNQNCCYKCGDSLDDIFCQRCTCKSCGNGAHIGYNCPPKAPIISNPEQCNQTMPSVHPTCNSGDENSFTYDSKPNFANDSPNAFNPPLQPQYVPYSCELCGNDSHYGYDCLPQVPFKEEEMRIAEDQAAKDRYWKIPICYDDDEIRIKEIISTKIEEPISIKTVEGKSGTCLSRTYDSYIFSESSGKRKIELIKDTIVPTNNGITEDVQPPVVPVENQNPVSELVNAPVSAPMPNPKPSIPYPSRRNDERHRENANEQKEKFLRNLQRYEFRN
ncbi:hypothetical protein Tco_0175385 [Tanacetum coccineum]